MMTKRSICPANAGRYLVATSIALSGLFTNAVAHADDRRDHFRHDKIYRSPHWTYDDRYHHGRYYPSIGYRVPVIPRGYLSLTFGGDRFFYQGGVWFRVATGGYVVVRAPIGIVVPLLPPEYDTVWIGDVPYYYANETYYTAAPGGYVVVAPPAEGQLAPAPAPQQAPGMWYYCDSAKAYYPYVNECPEGWRPVPATPPSTIPAR